MTFLTSVLSHFPTEWKLNIGKPRFLSLPQNLSKGTLLSKALTCMKLSLYNHKWLFYQGDGYLWLYWCMSKLNISYRWLHAPTYSFWALCSMLISRFFTSWVYSVCNIVTRWMNFREQHLIEHELQLSDYKMGIWLLELYINPFQTGTLESSKDFVMFAKVQGQKYNHFIKKLTCIPLKYNTDKSILIVSICMG